LHYLSMLLGLVDSVPHHGVEPARQLMAE
jgi:hypothetical protein